ILSGTDVATVDRSDVAAALIYRGTRGHLGAALGSSSNLVFHWKATNAVSNAQLAVLLVDTNGSGRLFRWTVTSPAAGACYRFALVDNSPQLAVDADCDGAGESSVAGTDTALRELPPTLINVFQDTTVQAGRPNAP